MAASLVTGRRLDLTILAAYLIALIIFAAYIRHQHNDSIRRLCVDVEHLKQDQRNPARYPPRVCPK